MFYSLPVLNNEFVGKIQEDFCPLIIRYHKFYYFKIFDSTRGVQPVAHGPHAAQDGYECGPTQNHKFT